MASRMPDAAHEGADEASANRDLWTQVSTDYTDEHAFRAWAASEITWGIFGIPEDQLDVRGEVADLDVAELGCGFTVPSAGEHHPAVSVILAYGCAWSPGGGLLVFGLAGG
jgi:hypothetical protein